jgi:hypothetical protein
VFAESGLGLTPRVRDRAAQLGVPGSVLAGLSAARVWDMPVPDSGPHLIVGRRVRRPPAVQISREILDRYDVQIFEGAPVTSRARTVFDCLRLLPDAAATDLLDRALQRGWIDLEELVERVRHHAGRWGAPRLVRLVGQVAVGTRSAGERRLAGLLREAGIVGWAANVRIGDERGFIGIADVVFREARLILEMDGWAFHVTPEAFQRDRERQNRLIGAGWTVLRFTWRDLIERPERVVATVRSMLAR